MIYYILVILAVLASACSQMLLKRGACKEYPTYVRQYLNGWVSSGYLIIGLAMLVNIYAMSKGVHMKEISILESVSYLFVPCLSRWLFKERITWKKASAIGIIIVGIIVFFM